MKAIFENIHGFFALGNTDLYNRLKIFSYGGKIKSTKDEIRDLNRKLGQESWEKGFIDTKAFPSAENLERFESLTAEKRAAVEAIEKELKELKSKRKELITHYQTKLKEQLDLKQPVDDELNELQVEVKRVRKEIKGAEHEMKTLYQKCELKKARLEEIRDVNVESNTYLKAEIESEYNLNKRFYHLKKENLELLQSNLTSFTGKIDKVRKVLEEHEAAIGAIKQDQKETLFKIRQNIQNLQERKYDLEEQMRKIRVEISPILEKLGAEVTMRRIQSEKLHQHYKKMDSLEERLDSLRSKRDRRKKECASIGFGVKVCYYGLIFAVVAAIAVAVAVVLT